MADKSFPVNNLLGTAKSREVQRALGAEMRHDRANAILHFLAAGHMELVLAEDYEHAGATELALRSRLSAASCLWRAGQTQQARALFDSLLQQRPERAQEIQTIVADLVKEYPALAS